MNVDAHEYTPIHIKISTHRWKPARTDTFPGARRPIDALDVHGYTLMHIRTHQRIPIQVSTYQMPTNTYRYTPDTPIHTCILISTKTHQKSTVQMGGAVGQGVKLLSPLVFALHPDQTASVQFNSPRPWVSDDDPL